MYNFRNNLFSEFLKVKNSAALKISIVSGIVLSLIFIYSYWDLSKLDSGSYQDTHWTTFFIADITPVITLIIPLFLTLLVSYIVSVESRNNTWKQVLSQPRTIPELYFSKIIVVLALVIGTTVLFVFFVALSSFLNQLFSLNKAIEKNVSIEGIISGCMVMFLFMFPTILIQYILSICYKSQLPALGVGTIGTVSSIFFTETAHKELNPYCYPGLAFKTFALHSNTSITLLLINLGIIITLIPVGLVLFKKTAFSDK
jgi:lantibiotic transport system permease protein